jgi:hypothetical protein
MMDKNEAVQKLAKVGRLSIAHAEDLYDSFFEKPVVSQCVADWYEENKKDFDYNLWDYLTSWDRQKGSDFKKWINNEIDVLQTLVNMHQFGYEVEKETKYTVRIKVTNQYLCNDDGILHFSPGFRMDFTKNDLEKLNLGWVFDCEGIEIEEVE